MKIVHSMTEVVTFKPICSFAFIFSPEQFSLYGWFCLLVSLFVHFFFVLFSAVVLNLMNIVNR